MIMGYINSEYGFDYNPNAPLVNKKEGLTAPQKERAMDQASVMDLIYRFQRHFYDMTRPLFLAGRNRLLQRIPASPGSTILEVGCGTARNLIVLARRYPELRLFGLDISEQMLQTARAKTQRRGLSRIQLVQGSAEDWNHHTTLSLAQPLDVIFFSYSLSMIPDWRKALDTAVRNLQPGGSLLIVDFWDQRDWPRWMRQMLTRWLGLFHVRHEPGTIDYLQTLVTKGNWTLDLESIRKRYAYLAQIHRSPEQTL